ncbi:ABC transporter substrate-binding protein [Treponema sp.]|uniref:ABC transporter substrate-binding protein n=1 Tax=Treponema sp. TaxID=166 RepID=UPI00298E5C6C|nr:ABC transporter substrate-binding protein [Treponema sp.]MCR5612067.1 ABC transporter substrate-binding protein [Treponema sp.]
MNRLIKTIAVSLVTLMAVSCGSDKKPKTIKIGFNIPLTGDSPKVGESGKYAGELIKEEINAAGGLEVKGEKYLLEFVYVDNELKADSAINAANKLIDIDKVLASIGPEGSGRAIPAGEIYNDAKVPMVSPWATNPSVTKDRPYCFRACFLDPFQAPVAAKFASEQFGGRKVAVIFNLEDDYSKTLAELFKAEWEAKYGEVVVYESFGQKDQDFSVQLTKVVNSDADFLYLPVYYNHVGLITSQAKDLGYKKPVMGSDSWGSADLFPLSKGAVEGDYFTTHYAAKGATGKTKEFIEKYQSTYGYVPDDVAALTYDATYLVLQAIQDCGITGNLKKDRTAIKDALGKIASFPGITGNMKFTPEGDPIKDAVVVCVTKEGEFEFVKSLQP